MPSFKPNLSHLSIAMLCTAAICAGCKDQLSTTDGAATPSSESAKSPTETVTESREAPQAKDAGEKPGEQDDVPPTINLKGAVAVATQTSGESGGKLTGSGDSATDFAIKSNGAVEELFKVSGNTRVLAYHRTKSGLLVLYEMSRDSNGVCLAADAPVPTTENAPEPTVKAAEPKTGKDDSGETTETKCYRTIRFLEFVLAKVDGTTEKIDIPSLGDGEGKVSFSGETQSGKLVFLVDSNESNAIYTYDPASKTVKALKSVFKKLEVQEVSGNFAWIRAELDQIWNIETGRRYTPSGNCENRIAAINEDYLLTACGSDILMKFSDFSKYPVGQISDPEAEQTTQLTNWQGNVVHAENKVFLLSSYCRAQGNSDDVGLCSVDKDGVLTILATGFSPNTSNGGGPLFDASTYFVIRETSSVKAVKKSDNSVSTILSGYTVASISVSGTKVYYLAEDANGEPKIGVFDLATGTDSAIDSQEVFDALIAL